METEGNMGELCFHRYFYRWMELRNVRCKIVGGIGVRCNIPGEVTVEKRWKTVGSLTVEKLWGNQGFLVTVADSTAVENCVNSGGKRWKPV